MRFLFDTDSISFALRGEGGVGDRLRRTPSRQVAVSAVSLAEVEYGLRKRKSASLARAARAFFNGIQVVPFGVPAARRYGRILNDLRRRGEDIGVADTMIAAQALCFEATLVTHNQRHFERVRGLEITDWY